MGDRLLDNWIASYLFYTEKQESPPQFHKWCAISAIAASMERNVWLDNGYYKLFPNQYIVLVGASASVRKSSAISLTEDIYRSAFPNGWLFSQKITPVALILFLRDSFKERKVSGGYIIADELSVFLGSAIQDASLVQMLTKIYTCPMVMDYSTVQRGREIANSTFCNMLGGTTPEWIKDSFPAHAVGGGFAGRIIFVYMDKTDRRFARPCLDEERRVVREKLIEDLKCIGSLTGKFTMTADAEKWYVNWYEHVFNPDAAETDLRGYYGRKHDLVLKLSMVFSVSRSSNMIIEEEDVVLAISSLGEVEKEMPETLRLIQSTQVGQNQQKILNHIRNSPGRMIPRSLLLNKMSYILSARDLEGMMETLIMSDRVEMLAEDGKIFYKLK